jgi:hypothetical protein
MNVIVVRKKNEIKNLFICNQNLNSIYSIYIYIYIEMKNIKKYNNKNIRRTNFYLKSGFYFFHFGQILLNKRGLVKAPNIL